MPTTQTPFSDYQIALMQAQRQQQLADALRQQSFQPIESYDSGVLKAPISYTQGLAKMLQAYAANKGQEKAIENMGRAYGMQYDMLRNMYGGGQDQQNPQLQPIVSPSVNTLPPYLQNQSQPIPQNQSSQTPQGTGQPIPVPQNQPTTQGAISPMGLRLPPGQTPESMASMQMMMPQVAGPLQAEWMKPDPTTLAAMNAGYAPPQIADIQRRTLEKGAYIAPLNLRPGSVPGNPYTGMPLPSAPAIGQAQAQNAGQIERAKQMNTVFPNMTVGGREGVPIWGGDIPHLGRSNPTPAPSQAPGMSSVPMPSISPTNTGFGMSPGTKAASGEMGKSGAGRFNSIVQLASESPMRINVLDNIINLSQEGVTTGPGQEWKNKVAGYIGNTPLLSMVPGIRNASTAVGKFQELQKFTYQNALRNWQAAGGTGTDAQMEAASHANPNDTLFPQALQQIAKWGKASELALQAKANAQDQWLSQPSINGDTSRQYEFENLWRQHFDPRIYQMTLMDPAELNQFTAKIPPQERQTILNKYRFAKQNGWIQ